MELYQELLEKAIDGESTAIARYHKYSEIALKEGFKNIAYMFQALGGAEQIHVKNHRNALKMDYTPQIGSTESSTSMTHLVESHKTELWEHKEMYPGLLAPLGKKKDLESKVARLSMEWAMKVELTHAQAINIAIEALSKGVDLEVDSIYICRVCGSLILGKKVPEFCPVCGHDQSFYIEVARVGEI